MDDDKDEDEVEVVAHPSNAAVDSYKGRNTVASYLHLISTTDRHEKSTADGPIGLRQVEHEVHRLFKLRRQGHSQARRHHRRRALSRQVSGQSGAQSVGESSKDSLPEESEHVLI